MTEKSQKQHSRILRDLARKGSIVAVATDPSPLLESALEDVVTALLCRLKFVQPGHPLTWNALDYLEAFDRYRAVNATKEDAMLRAGEDHALPLGTATTRAAKLKRLEKHHAKALEVHAADALIEYQFSADTNRKKEIALTALERRLQEQRSAQEQQQAELDRRDEVISRREKQYETARMNDLAKKHGV